MNKVSASLRAWVGGPRPLIGSNPFLRNLGSMGAAQIATRVSRLAATLALSRILTPGDFGLAAIVLTTYELVAVFTRNGIGAKVVQASDGEVGAVAETAYWMTWAVCILLAVAQVVVAAPIAWVFHDDRLFVPIALMSAIYLVTPLMAIQYAFQQREGRLGRVAFASAAQVITDNILTAILALCGLGMWAIILPKLLVAPIFLVLVRRGHAWRPAKWRSFEAAFHGWREITHFSAHVLGVELMTTFQANVDNLFVGLFLGVQALGMYYFAFNAGLGITLGLVNAFGGAIYSHLCQARGDGLAMTRRYDESVKRVGWIVAPLVLLQTLLAPIYVPLVFGAKWTPAIPVLMLICLSALARPFASAASQLLRAVGRPAIELRWQTNLTLALTAALLVASQFNVLAVAFAVFVVQTVFLSAFFFIAPKPFLVRGPVLSVGAACAETPHG